MKHFEAVKILKRYGKIDAELEAAERHYKRLCDEIDMIAAIPSPVQKIDGMPHTGVVAQATESVALRRIQLAEANRPELERRNNNVLKLMQFKHKVEDAFILCDVMDEQVATMHWIQKVPYRVISEVLHIDKTTAWRHDQKVLTMIEEVFGIAENCQDISGADCDSDNTADYISDLCDIDGKGDIQG